MRIGFACLGFLLGAAALPVVAQNAPSAEDPARIILVVNGALGDRSFFDSAARGLQMIEGAHGEAVETEVLEIGDDPSAWEPALLDVSEGDWDLIIGGTFSMSEVFGSVAEQYPDNQYILFDASLPNEDGRYDNIYMVEYKQNEGSYLGGMLAASLLSSGALPAEAGGALGFSGGMDIPVINDFLVGYVAGAQAVNPDIKIAVSYIGSFTDAAKGKEVGLAQFREGVVLSFVAASQAGLGQIQAAAEEGRFILGVDSDQEAVLRETDEAMADTVVSSVLKNVDVSLLRAYDLWLAGELPFGQVEKVGLAEGAVGLVETGAMSRLADQATRDAIAEATRDIETGEIVVPTAFGMEQDALDSLREAVRP